MRIITGSEMKQIDAWAMEERGLPSAILMENAGRAVASRALALMAGERALPVVLFVGKGNNGGDALVAARHLVQEGADVKLFLLFPPREFQPPCRENWQYIKDLGVRWHLLEDDNSFHLFKLSLNNCGLVIDGLFGTGFKGAPQGKMARAIQLVNESGRPVLAIDVPSGLNADTGAVGNPCIQAHDTVTFAWPKLGLVVYPGKELAGNVTVADISLPAAGLDILEQALYWVQPSRVRHYLPQRDGQAHKNTFGHVLVVAGSRGMLGAAILTSKAVLRAGAGLVTACLPDSLADVFDATVYEVMTQAVAETAQRSISSEAWSDINRLQEDKKALVFGPGLGQHAEVQVLLHKLLETAKVPLVIDADGLNALAGDISLLKKARVPLVLTPHPGEMARLLGVTSREIQENRIGAVRAAAMASGAVVVLKGAGTLTALPQGEVYLNSTGCPALATAGSGDVLAGTIGSLLAQGLPAKEAALLGVFVHGLSGDLLAQDKGMRGIMAGDILENLPRAFKTLEHGDPRSSYNEVNCT